MRRRDALIVVLVVVLLVGVVAWTAFSISGSKPTAQPVQQPVHKVQYTSVFTGWMISNIVISASNVTGGYDTHPNIYGHLLIRDSQGKTIVDTSWSKTTDWFGSYTQNFDNFTLPNTSLQRLLNPSSIGNTTALLVPNGSLEITVQSGTFHNTASITLPAESQHDWCNTGNTETVDPFYSPNNWPSSSMTINMPNFTVLITFVGVGHCVSS